jgi:hypothetical protein
MLEITATLTCDRCGKTICEMNNIDDEAEARQRLSEADWLGSSEDEDGDDVCAACWAKFDAKQRRDNPKADSAEILSDAEGG